LSRIHPRRKREHFYSSRIMHPRERVKMESKSQNLSSIGRTDLNHGDRCRHQRELLKVSLIERRKSSIQL
jgi:hypothetical protein